MRGLGEERWGRGVSTKITGRSGGPPAPVTAAGRASARLSPGWAGSAGSAPHPGSYRVPPRRQTQSRLGAPTPPGKWSPSAGLAACEPRASGLHPPPPRGHRGLLGSAPSCAPLATRFGGPLGSSFPWQSEAGPASPDPGFLLEATTDRRRQAGN